MRLLIVTQAVDRADPVLGFFHRWIEEFAKRCESVETICLFEGEHDLPAKVQVHSLGKERGRRSRLAYSIVLGSLIWKLRSRYDAVFVHMNPEYVALAGPDWKLMGKRVGLWYTHKSVTPILRIAALFADLIFTASKESFRLPSAKARVMGHGIDTEFFTPDPSISRGVHWLSAGRLMPAKRHDLAIRAAEAAGKELRIAGEGPERAGLEALAREIGARVIFLGALSQEQMREAYRRAALLIHRSETGSLDKVVLEAAACGCPVDTSDPAIAALPLSSQYVRDQHSLSALIPRVLAELAPRQHPI